jgi:hypothetical protein
LLATASDELGERPILGGCLRSASAQVITPRPRGQTGLQKARYDMTS